MNKKADKKLRPLEKVVIILAVIGATIVATGGIKANRDVSAMIENSKFAEDAAQEYYQDVGEWPTTKTSINIPLELIGAENQLADLDEEKLIKEGYLEELSGSKVDFGIVTSGPDEGLTFFSGNDGKGVYKISGNRYYGKDLYIKGSPAIRPIIPVPVPARLLVK